MFHFQMYLEGLFSLTKIFKHVFTGLKVWARYVHPAYRGIQKSRDTSISTWVLQQLPRKTWLQSENRTGIRLNGRVKYTDQCFTGVTNVTVRVEEVANADWAWNETRKKVRLLLFLFYPWLVPGFQHNLKNQLNLYSLAGIFLCYFFLVGCVGVLQICSCSYQKFGEDSRGWIWIIFKGFESTSLPVAGLLSQWFINAFLGGGFKHFYFHPYLGKMIQFD